jgi:hypothetical protein
MQSSTEKSALKKSDLLERANYGPGEPRDVQAVTPPLRSVGETSEADARSHHQRDYVPNVTHENCASLT